MALRSTRASLSIREVPPLATKTTNRSAWPDKASKREPVSKRGSGPPMISTSSSLRAEKASSAVLLAFSRWSLEATDTKSTDGLESMAP